MPDAMQWEDRIVQTELGGRILNDALPAPLQRLAPGTAVRVTVEPLTPPIAAGGGTERCSTCGGPVMRCECCTTPGFDTPPASAPGGAVGEEDRLEAIRKRLARWPEATLTPNIVSDDPEFQWPCLRHEEDSHVSFEYRHGVITDQRQNETVRGPTLEVSVDVRPVNFFCANCDGDLAESIAMAPQDIRYLLAAVRRAAEQGRQQVVALIVTANTQAIPHHSADWMNGFAAGQRAMRSAVATGLAALADDEGRGK